jgi:hypothetical protein
VSSNRGHSCHVSTDAPALGVHPIFGGFLAGLIIPHEGGFAIALVEKIDDLVSMLFLPIVRAIPVLSFGLADTDLSTQYFVLSGLQTNLGLLNTGTDWGYIILIGVVAFLGKFIGCAGVAKLLKYTNRESGAIGMLMSCKGFVYSRLSHSISADIDALSLVELIVLNVGLSAGIIDQRLFSMFVVDAVILTFITTPFTLWIYPERFRTPISANRDLQRSRDFEKRVSGLQALGGGSGGREHTAKFLVVLQKIEHLSAVMLLTQMLEPPPARTRKPPIANEKALMKASSGKLVDGDISDESATTSPSRVHSELPVLTEDGAVVLPGSIHIDALKLIELTGRTFSVMQSAEKDQLLLTDDALQLFRQFGRLRGLEITPHISIVGLDSFPATVAEHAEGLGSELVLLPWTVPVVSGSSALIDPSPSVADHEALPSSSSPLESVFGADSHGSPMYTHFLRRVFTECPADIALFVDRGFGSSSSFVPGAGQHIFLPFFGGPDDRLALRFVVQLCQHNNVTATVVRIERSDGDSVDSRKLEVSEGMQAHQAALQSNQLTVGPTNPVCRDLSNY